MNKVELHQAWMWDCDNCGRENFTRGIRPELSIEDKLFLKEERDIDIEDEGEFIMMPPNVTCNYCKSSFAVLHED